MASIFNKSLYYKRQKLSLLKAEKTDKVPSLTYYCGYKTIVVPFIQVNVCDCNYIVLYDYVHILERQRQVKCNNELADDMGNCVGVGR